MRTILCYGDSNTWGFNAETGSRFSKRERWPVVANDILGDDYDFVESGIGGRSAQWDSPFNPAANGSLGLVYAVMSARPIDLVILMLGTNDLKYADAQNTARAQQCLIRQIRGLQHSLNLTHPPFTGGEPRILLCSPPLLGRDLAEKRHTVEPFLNANESAKLASCYSEVAKAERAYFLDAALYTKVPATDGMHISAESHASLGRAVAAKVKEIFANEGLITEEHS